MDKEVKMSPGQILGVVIIAVVLAVCVVICLAAIIRSSQISAMERKREFELYKEQFKND